MRNNYNSPQSTGGSSAALGFIALLLVLGLVFLVVTGPRLIGSRPSLTVAPANPRVKADAKTGIAVGKELALTVTATNEKHGVCRVKGVLSQGAAQKEVLLHEASSGSLFKSWGRPWSKSATLAAKLSDVSAAGFAEGPAQLLLAASDCSYWGRTEQLTQPLTVDLSPPRVSLTSAQHYVNQGGADVATYTVSPDAAWSGVRVGPYEFTGHKKPGSPEGSGESFSFFVYSYELPPDTPIEIVALDAAGNEGRTTLTPARFFPKEFRHREIPIDDKFIETKVADIIASTPELKSTGKNVDNFLLVNSELRKKNARFLVDISRKSEETFFWKDAFRPLTNASVEANFADYRSYLYNGEVVDKQVHLGFDLAVVEKHPILAAAAGKVLFSGYLGIYGNTVIIDHGYGLITLYAHLSGMDVAVGDRIAKDQKIGNSGATGLAGGDHLHFSLLIDGVQTNPVEFWDQHWIDDHVYLRLGTEAFGKGANP